MKNLLIRLLNRCQRKLESRESTISQKEIDKLKARFKENTFVVPECKKCAHFLGGARMCSLNWACSFKERAKYGEN